MSNPGYPRPIRSRGAWMFLTASFLATPLLITACAPAGIDPVGATGGTTGAGSGGTVAASGGSTASGGSSATGGISGPGGAIGTGGTIGSGGTIATGGSTATGGRGTGGATATGGRGTGGATGTGGSTPTGGRGTGGSPATGGATATGGRGTGGTTGSGGVTGTGGRGTGGVTTTGGATGTGGAATGTCAAPTFPTPVGTEKVFSSTQRVTRAAGYDGKMALHNGSGSELGMDCSSSAEQTSVDPIFDVEDGGTIKNVIFGKFAADGIHCLGSCTIENVWWTDLCDDAATFLGTAASTAVTINGGGARYGADKTLQHNGAGTVTINNFFVEQVGKMYRSCGTCSPQPARHVIVNNPTAITVSSDLIGVNQNHGDTAVFSGTICVRGVSRICTRYDDTTRVASGSDGVVCTYAASAVKTF